MKKPGMKKASLEREPAAKLGQYIKSFIKTNYGGNDPAATVAAKLAARGVTAGPVTAHAVVAIVEEQVDTIRAATYPRIDEAMRRVAACDLLLSLFNEWVEERAQSGRLPEPSGASAPQPEELP